MTFNWIDLIIIGVCLYQGYQGWEAGFFPLATSLISFVIALWMAVTFQSPVSAFLVEKFGLYASWSTVLAYIVVAFGVQIIVERILQILLKKIPKRILHSKISNWIGAGVSILNGLVFTIFFFLIVLTLPIRGTIKNDIKSSVLGSMLTVFVQNHGGPLTSAVNEVGQSAVKFFTVASYSEENISLDVIAKSSDLRIDAAAEEKMMKMVNTERVKAHVPKLKIDPKIIDVARVHSRDMFLRRYFSHNTPEHTDAGDRMSIGGVSYSTAGENLAYSPDVETAHTGLMNSPEHKKNILDPSFTRIGIGIIATDKYGIMVTQNFAN